MADIDDDSGDGRPAGPLDNRRLSRERRPRGNDLGERLAWLERSDQAHEEALYVINDAIRVLQSRLSRLGSTLNEFKQTAGELEELRRRIEDATSRIKERVELLEKDNKELTKEEEARRRRITDITKIGGTVAFILGLIYTIKQLWISFFASSSH